MSNIPKLTSFDMRCVGCSIENYTAVVPICGACVQFVRQPSEMLEKLRAYQDKKFNLVRDGERYQDDELVHFRLTLPEGNALCGMLASLVCMTDGILADRISKLRTILIEQLMEANMK